MVHIITSRNAHLYEQELESCYRLRHQVFVEERGWNAIRRPDGREIDQFDTPSATHLAVIRDGKLAAYSRILPTTEPHLLSDVYPWLVATGDIPRGPHIWEWTRLCVAPEFRWGNSLSDAGWEAILGIVEYSLANGIFLLTGEGHPIWITRSNNRSGFGVENGDGPNRRLRWALASRLWPTSAFGHHVVGGTNFRS